MVAASKYVAIDLFSGTGSATRYFRESDKWRVIGVDINPEKDRDIKSNILDISPEDLGGSADFVWASPPCNTFSIASIGHYWTKKNDRLRLPTEDAVTGVRLVYHTLWLINSLQPQYWFMENPRGGMRKLIGEPQLEHRDGRKPDRDNPGTVTYCQYGDNRMKPTDLWGEHPESFEYRFCGNGSPCHESSPRGSKTGTEGRKKKRDRWKVPDGLSKMVYESVTTALDSK